MGRSVALYFVLLVYILQTNLQGLLQPCWEPGRLWSEQEGESLPGFPPRETGVPVRAAAWGPRREVGNPAALEPGPPSPAVLSCTLAERGTRGFLTTWGEITLLFKGMKPTARPSSVLCPRNALLRKSEEKKRVLSQRLPWRHQSQLRCGLVGLVGSGHMPGCGGVPRPCMENGLVPSVFLQGPSPRPTCMVKGSRKGGRVIGSGFSC